MHLIEKLIHELNITRQQAEGGLGLLFEQAQWRLSSAEFLQVADAIPAVSDLISKAPRELGPGFGPLRNAWQQWFSGWGTLACLQSRCEGLGIDRAEIDQFIAVIGTWFREQDQTEAESLLLSVWR